MDAPGRPSQLRQLVRRGMAAALPRQMFLVSGPATSDGVCVTFDDGPHPDHTPVLLDGLARLGVRATFFVLGRQAERHPEIVRRMVSEGHRVGQHSYSHGDPSTTSALELAREVRRTSSLLQATTGRVPRLFRPPHGKLTAGKTLALWACGQSIVLWNRDAKDFACASSQPLREWFAQTPLVGGDVLLLHDVHPHAAGALDVLAQRVRERGLRFTTPDEWLSMGSEP